MNRWWRLGWAVLAMVLIANLQYTWTLFVHPLMAAHGWALAQVQVAFAAFVACQTWLTPAAGWLIDRAGSRRFIAVGGVLCGLGWGLLGRTATLTELYACYAGAGVGASLVYSGCMAVALKWFPDKRGLASGLAAGGFGAGAALSIPVIAHVMRFVGYREVLLVVGVAVTAVVLVAAGFLRNPQAHEVAAAPPARRRLRSHDEEFNILEMMRTPQFYVLYLTMLMIGIGGLTVTANLAPLSRSLGMPASVVTVALSLGVIANGASRTFWGWVSDYTGRERAMALAFVLQAASMASLLALGRTSPTAFIAGVAMVFFTWGEIYVLFPAIAADLFGWRNAAANSGVIYSTKGVASIMVVVSARLFETHGNWNAVIYGNAGLALAAAILALAFLKMPMPRKARVAEAAKIPV